MGSLTLPGMSVVSSCGFFEPAAGVSHCREFDCSGIRTSVWISGRTSPSNVCGKKALQSRRSSCSLSRFRILYLPTYFPATRALWSRKTERQESSAPDEFSSIKSSSRTQPPDLKEDIDELPSLFKAKRRQNFSPGTKLGSGGDGGGGWGFFHSNDSSRDSGGSGASFKASGPNNFVLAGLFVMGIGAGIALDTVVNVEPSNVASREVIDRQTPNPDVCIANGMSAMVLDQRLFITFNPFNVYVSQAEVKPGCVLQQSNWRVLESRGLVNSEEVRDCKRNFNTFGFVGDLRQAPEITCVYHSENAENQFLKDPSKAALGDGFQPKTFSEP